MNTTGQLEIRTSTFQMNPLMNFSGSVCFPILGIDLWEHAYYLKFTHDRSSYVSTFSDLVDWPVVQYFYDNFASKQTAVPF